MAALLHRAAIIMAYGNIAAYVYALRVAEHVKT